MITKKFTLNELRTLVKQIIKEETGNSIKKYSVNAWAWAINDSWGNKGKRLEMIQNIVIPITWANDDEEVKHEISSFINDSHSKTILDTNIEGDDYVLHFMVDGMGYDGTMSPQEAEVAKAKFKNIRSEMVNLYNKKYKK